MDLLSVSSSSSSSSLLFPHSFLSASKLSHHFSSSSFRPPNPKLKISCLRSTTTTTTPTPKSPIMGGPPQRPGTEGDAMGLLLKERIVFLGSPIDDFVADAIISQLLLLDALDHTKDIRLFVNSPGGALRFFLLLLNLQ